MYLPSSDPTSRAAITEAFKSYAKKEEAALGDKYGIRTHWAKIELPEDADEPVEHTIVPVRKRHGIAWLLGQAHK